MSNLQIDSVLAQIRQIRQQAQISPDARLQRPDATGTAAPAPASFANVLRQGLDQVNQAQVRASDLADRFERGVPGVELSQVMLETQKATVAFRATTEIRNRLVSAYQEIMNMPV